MSIVSGIMKENLEELSKKVKELYISNNINENKSLLRQLNNPMSIDEQDMNDNLKSVDRVTQVDHNLSDNSVDLIYRGNYKLNFQERLEDKDLLILVQALRTQENIYDKIRHIDLSYNNLSDNSVGELISLCSKWNYLKSLNLQGNRIGS